MPGKRLPESGSSLYDEPPLAEGESDRATTGRQGLGILSFDVGQ